MQCINDNCTGMETRVVESRPTQAVTYRRRQCALCKTMYVTTETVARTQRIPFDACKPKEIA